MNTLELIEHRILVSLFIDAHRPDRRYLTRDDLRSEYNTEVDPRLFISIVHDLRNGGLIKATPSGGTFAVRLHGTAHKAALAAILKMLDADYFEVDWPTKRIITDFAAGDPDRLIPCGNNWVLLTTENGRAKPAGKVPATDQESPGPQVQSAGRDINHFYGAVHGGGVKNRSGRGGDSGWTRWGTILTGVGSLVAIIALGAAWYFWRYPHQ